MLTVMLQGRRVTDRVFSPAQLERLRASGAELRINPSDANPTPEEALRLIEGAEVLITSWGCPPLTAELLDRAPRLRAVLHAAGSVKPIATPELRSRGIPVTSGAAILGRGVGEFALCTTMMSLKKIALVSEAARREGWWAFRSDPLRNSIREMYGSTIGCIGGGNAGRHFLKLLRSFSVTALLADPAYTPEQARELGAELVPLEELLRRSDVVVVLAPELPSTYRMLDGARIGLMRDGATLINLARGSLIDEQALAEHLRAGRIHAVLDVLEQEPPGDGHPLRELPNVVLTGHIAGAVNNGLLEIGEFMADEWLRVRDGEPLAAAVPLERLDWLA